MSLAGRIIDVFWRVVARKIAPYLARTPVIFGDARKVRIAPGARVVNALMNVQSGTITIEENAFLGHDVLLLTGSHDLEKTGAERRDAIIEAGRDIIIGEGAWINSGAIVIGPCTIGAHSVVLSGSVVTRDVPCDAIVGGIPARLIRMAEGLPS